MTQSIRYTDSVTILYEDDDVVAAAKPAGQPTIPGRGDAAEGAFNLELEGVVGRKLFVVHRLDREASGLLLFAKTAAAHARLCAEFEGRRARKTYLALVDGSVAEPGEIEAPLKEFGSGRVGAAAAGKASSTRYAPRAAGQGCTLLTVEPKTGRRHQIRVHLYSVGHAILGDPLYGSPRPVGGAPRLMLHALALGLSGLPPLICPPGPDFLAVLEARGCVGGSNFF